METCGWETESNIFWNRELFTEVEHGTCPIGINEAHPNRFLFWVRLQRRHSELLLASVG
jgi:hypothetical protein